MRTKIGQNAEQDAIVAQKSAEKLKRIPEIGQMFEDVIGENRVEGALGKLPHLLEFVDDLHTEEPAAVHGARLGDLEAESLAAGRVQLMDAVTPRASVIENRTRSLISLSSRCLAD